MNTLECIDDISVIYVCGHQVSKGWRCHFSITKWQIKAMKLWHLTSELKRWIHGFSILSMNASYSLMCNNLLLSRNTYICTHIPVSYSRYYHRMLGQLPTVHIHIKFIHKNKVKLKDNNAVYNTHIHMSQQGKWPGTTELLWWNGI